MHRNAIAALACLLALNPPAAGAAATAPTGDGPWVLRAYGWTEDDVRELAAHFDHFGVYPEKGMLLIQADGPDELALLEAAGLTLEVDADRTDTLRTVELYRSLGLGLASIPGFDCYRTVEETLATGAAIAAEHPGLAQWIDIGDSWQKENPGNGVGWDLWALRLTNQAVPGPKPSFLILGSNHAREYVTAEVATRFAELLVGRYGSDPDVTWLLDHNEVHLVLVMNPDGRKQAETGDGQARKNRDNDFCSNTATRGIDLNRNFDFMWGNAVCNGSSASACSLSFHGPSAGSEPETQAIQDYMAAIFPDQRPDDQTTPAPPTAEGIVVDLHSFGEVVLTSWGCVGVIGPPPNSAGIRTLARKIAYFPGYDDLLGSTGLVDGSTKDFSYGRLGVPGYTIEMGTSFFEGCPYFHTRILEPVLEALLHTAKNARTPYLTPAGPDIVDPAGPALPLAAGDPAGLSALVDDTRYNTAAEPVQTIAGAAVTVDTPPWLGGTPQALAAADGTFDQTVEAVVGTVDTTGLAAGRHSLFLRGEDAGGSFGAVGALFLWIVDPALSPAVQGTVTDAATGGPLAATVTVGPFEVATDPLDGSYSLQLPSGTYDVAASAPGYGADRVSGVVLADLDVVTLDLEPTPLVTVFEDNVEAGDLGWTAQPPWAITTEAANSPINSWTDSPGTNYPPNADTSLTSPIFDLSALSDTRLSFRHIYDLEPGFDGGSVEISTDGGTSWTAVEFYSDADQTAVWQLEELPLPALDGAAQARFRFRLRSDGGLQRDGWHLDDVLLEAAPALVFADGFESGDTSAWSAVAPFQVGPLLTR